MTSRNVSKTGSAAGIIVKPQKGTTLKVMLAPNVEGKLFCVLSHQSGNLLTTPRTSDRLRKLNVTLSVNSETVKKLDAERFIFKKLNYLKV